MKSTVQNLLRNHASLYRIARATWVLAGRATRPLHPLLEHARWQLRGRPVPPPPRVKQRIVRSYGRVSRATTLVETGTYLGDMVEAQRRHFARVISVELSPELHHAATLRFSGCSNVTLIEGDSGKVIGEVVGKLDEPALFWLDGHSSGGVTARGEKDTPILEELDAVLASPLPNWILIDDAREFGKGDYPSLTELEARALTARPDWAWSVRDDIIRFHPSTD